MTLHEERATEIAQRVNLGCESALVANESVRQGDVVLQRVGDSRVHGQPTPSCGKVIAAGTHGEHRLVAESLSVTDDGNTLDLAFGGLLVHTDVPSSRHQAIKLIPGIWKIYRQQELSNESIVTQVVD